MATYLELAQNIEAVRAMGDAIADSQMFGCQSKSQGFVIACECFLNGKSLLDFQKRNDLIGGRPSIPYDAMLASFIERGGKVKIIEKSPDAAKIELSIRGETKEFSLTWQDLQQEPTPYHTSREYPESKVIEALAKGEKPALKAKYATPRSRAIMLFARLVSDAIRTMAPDVNFGCYTPEEIGDFTSTGSTDAVAPTKVVANEPVKVVETKTVPFEPNVEQVETKPVTSYSVTDPLTTEMKNQILELMQQIKQAGQPDIVSRVQAKLKASGLAKLNDLTIAEGEALLSALRVKNIEAWVDYQLAGHSPSKA